MTQANGSAKHAIIFVLLIFMWITLVAVVAFHNWPANFASEHARHAQMEQGGSGEIWHKPLLKLGWLFAILEIATFVTLLSLALRQKVGGGSFARLLLVGGAVYAGVMTALFVAYDRYLSAAEPSFAGPFPAPTAWMIFGVWTAPLAFVILYVVFFNRSIVTDDDLQRFEQLLALRDQKAEGS